MKMFFFLYNAFAFCSFAGIVIPVIVPDGEHRTMAEDFPISLYVDYGDHDPITQPTSVVVNLPDVEVLQHTLAYGAIDTSASHLPYAPLAADPDLLAALDFDHDGDGLFWYVDGGRTLFYEDRNTGAKGRRQVWGHVELTEIATPAGSDDLWVYDACRGDLLRLNKRFPWCYTRFRFSRPMEISGLAVDDSSVYLVDTALGRQVIYQFEIGRYALDYAASWQVLGFENALITDLALVPDGGFLIATTDPELGLVLIEDKLSEAPSPIENTAELVVVAQQPLPAEIKQPSGLWRNAAGHWFMTTDQAEVFELDGDFQSLERFDVNYQSIQCNQGCTEAVSGRDGDLYVLTDLGYVARYQTSSQGYQYREEFDIAYPDGAGGWLPFSGLTYRAETDTFFLISDGGAEQADVLLEVDSVFNALSRRTLTYQGDVVGSLFDYDAAGVQLYNGKIYVLSDLYNDLLEISLEGEVLRTFGIDPAVLREPTDLFIHDDLVYVVGDHENDEPTPPLTVFALPQ